MKPIQLPSTNKIIVAEGCRNLPVTVKDGIYTSVWELEGDEFMELLQTKRIKLSVFTKAHPPVFIGVYNDELNKKGDE